jgi:hypothetical protein
MTQWNVFVGMVKMQCPVCGRVYDFKIPPEKMPPEDMQKVIDSTYIP